ncbi:hypothetical protein BDN72DRAFT_964167 [Pluteus cervinus]|uniref:Uncharacterized protein n=1 Tax=Pluteus cervinus TaxID=181527 RepID=A0ACD3ACM4_9AGAR|nr:hypothetical protein BDN72DRAFT_964167 [Pluteus cervinus]
MHFAVELISLFFEHVIAGANPTDISSTLRACCLVCRQWRDIAQPLLLSQFTRFKDCYSNQKLIKTLETSSHLTKHVRAIWLDDAWLQSQSDEDDDFFILRNTLSLVTHLGVLFPFPDGGDNELWYSIQDVFISAFSSKHLTCLFIKNGEIPIDLLYLCPALCELDLLDVRFMDKDSDDSDGEEISLFDSKCTPCSPRPQLLRLTIESETLRASLPILRWFMDPRCAFDLSSLRTFRALDDSNDEKVHESTLDFMQFVGSSLEHFTIHPLAQYLMGGDQGAYDRARYLKNLKSLQIGTEQHDEYGYFNGLPYILNFLEHLPNPNMFETLLISCYFDHSNHRYEDYINQGWGKLNSLLTGSSTRFSNLKEVIVRLDMLPNFPMPFDGVKNTLPSVLPELQERGCLNIVEAKSALQYPAARQPWIPHGPDSD